MPAWRAGPTNPGALKPVELEYEAEAVRVGVTADTPTVIVHDGASPSDMGAAARVYWTLKSLGVEDLALLNGGYRAWAEAGLPTATGQGHASTGSDFNAEWRDDWYIPTSEVVDMVESGDARLVDGRPEGFFEGITWSIARPGTIRGAENLQFTQFFEDGLMVSADRARAIAARRGCKMRPQRCPSAIPGIGPRSTGSRSANWPRCPTRGSMPKAWPNTHPGHALDNEPGRVAYLWLSTKRWVEGLF